MDIDALAALQQLAPLLVTPEDAAPIARRTPRTIRRYIAEGRLRSFRLGLHGLYLERAAVEALAATLTQDA